MNKLICKKCGREILPENDKALKAEYPYYCGFCECALRRTPLTDESS